MKYKYVNMKREDIYFYNIRSMKLRFDIKFFLIATFISIFATTT